MKKLLPALCLLALPLFAAQPREALLTHDGKFFTIESRVTNDDGASVSGHLLLRSQQGTDVATEIVPGTLDGASHREPAIAYDAETRTLFVFWLRHESLFSNELMFACRDANGTWSPARTFGDRFDYRENLRIAVTRRVADTNGKLLPAAAISVHLSWWEDDSDGEPGADEYVAYAMFVIENGTIVGEPQYVKLNQFVKKDDGETEQSDEIVDLTVLKQPHLFASSEQDSVLVVFGDVLSKRIHQVRIRPSVPPVANGRLRVPVGRNEGSVGTPRFSKSANGRIEGIYGGSDRMAFFSRDNDRLAYVLLKGTTWSEMRSIALDNEVTGSAAVDALRRLVHEQ
ncbi:MAG TPA: hypothetical protein VEK11_13275 [Thermoanaerobaculia bacterium]|jgi:hypothetical protein|nr:hypothetical protein [Thermoanaerobaculia bacterium]